MKVRLREYAHESFNVDAGEMNPEQFSNFCSEIGGTGLYVGDIEGCEVDYLFDFEVQYEPVGDYLVAVLLFDGSIKEIE